MSNSTALGVRQNARLTALSGALLFVLLAVEGVTLLEVHSMLTLHLAVGGLITIVVLLKLGTTGYKIVRYYTGSPTYKVEGPPPIVRRLLGPVVIVLTIALLFSGIMLTVLGPMHGGNWMFLHKASFVLWFLAMTVHVLVHLANIINGFMDEYFVSRAKVLPGRLVRSMALLASIAAGVGFGIWLTTYTSLWHLTGFGQ